MYFSVNKEIKKIYQLLYKNFLCNVRIQVYLNFYWFNGLQKQVLSIKSQYVDYPNYNWC